MMTANIKITVVAQAFGRGAKNLDRSVRLSCPLLQLFMQRGSFICAVAYSAAPC